MSNLRQRIDSKMSALDLARQDTELLDKRLIQALNDGYRILRVWHETNLEDDFLQFGMITVWRPRK